MNWLQHTQQLCQYLNGTRFLGRSATDYTSDQAFLLLNNWTRELRSQHRTIFFIGNGASASMSSHMAADFSKNGRIHTQTFTDLALITALANDVSYADVFRIPLQNRGHQGDILVAISSSGSSLNILRAAEAARDLDMIIVTLTGMSETNPLRQMGDLNIWVPAPTYGYVETAHAALLHYWMDGIES